VSQKLDHLIGQTRQPVYLKVTSLTNKMHIKRQILIATSTDE